MKKFLKVAGVVILSILVLLVVTPFFFKDKIQEEVKKLANRSLRSEVNFGQMSLSFFSHFPNLTLTLYDFSLKGSPPFNNDTLLSAREVGLGVDIKSLFGKTIRITRVYLGQGLVNILYNEKGLPNYEVYETGDTISTTDSVSGSGAEMNIEHITFTNCRLVYSDASIPARVVVNGFNYKGTSKVTQDFFDVTSDIRIDSLDLYYDNQKYLDGKPVTAKMHTKVNSHDLSINFEKNDLKVKDIPLTFNGKFNFEKDGYTLKLTVLSVMDKEFLSARFKMTQGARLYISAKSNASINLEKWSRAFDLKAAEVKGFYDLNLNAEGYYSTGIVTKGIRKEPEVAILSIPKFELMTKLTNGYLKYKALPQSFSNINFTLNATCPDSDYRKINVQLESLQATFLKNQINGYFRVKNLADMPVDAKITANCNLAEIKQVYPIDSIDLAGIVSIDVNIKGNYAPEKKVFPVTTAMISLKNGSVLTKYYPHPLEKMEMSVEVTNHSGTMQDLVVKVNPLNFEFEGKPFTLSAFLENFDDMRYDIRSKGTINLGKVYKVFSQKGVDLDGFIETDLSLKGRQSDATGGRLDKLSNHGTLKLRDIELSSENYPKPFIIKTGDFRFDQDKIWFENFLATYGKSDFRLKGAMKNTINYFLSQGGTLQGDFHLNSDYLDVDEFMVFSSEETTDAKPAETGVVIIPRDLDVDFDAMVKKTTFKGLNIKDMKGEIDLKEGILVLSKAGFNLIGCKVNMSATYGSITPEKAHFEFQVNAENFDIKRAYNEIAMIRELASSAEKAEGIVSLDYSLKGRLNAEMYPVLPSLEGSGTVSLQKIKVYGLKLFNDISKSTQKEGISNPDMSKVDIRSTIKNNVITLEQFKFKVSGIRIRISGTTTLDSRLNLRIRLGLPPLGIFGIPLKVTGPMEDLKIKYGRGKDDENIPDSEYSDELPPEMLQRIKNAKDDGGDEPEGK